MATTYNDNGGNTPNGSHLNFTYTFPYLKTEDVKVALNGVTQATTKYSVNTGVNPTRIEFNNTSIDATVQESSGAPKTGVIVRVYRDTDVELAKAVFAAGSSIRAQNLNDNQEQLLYHAQEEQNQLERLTDADIIPTAEIAVSKLKDGTARQILQTDAGGTGVEWTSNIDVPGTLDVTGAVDFDSNLNVDGTLTVDGVSTLTGNITVGGTVDGRDLATDGSKLDGIEAGSTGDQTNAEIRAAVEAATDSNVFTDADHTKLNAIEASADVTDATNVNAAGAVMNSDLDGKGEILIGDGSGDPTPLAVGSNTYVLTADSGEATGVKWAAATGGGAAITIQDEGNALSTAAETINFVGSGVTASGTGVTKTITISGGGGSTSTDFKYLELKAHNNASGAFSAGAADYELVTKGTTTAITPAQAAALIISVGGVIQEPNTGTSIGSNDGFCVDGSSIHFGANLTAHPDFIIYLQGAGVAAINDGSVTTVKIADENVTLAKLEHGDGSSNGKFLRSNNGADPTWETVSTTSEGTGILSTGESGTTKFLRVDGDGSCSWQVPPDTNTQLSNAEVRTAVEAATDSNVFTDNDHTKLDGIATGATATPTTTRGDIIYRAASADARLAKGTAGQYLKIGANDPEWADVVAATADGCLWENNQTISNNYTIASGKGAHSVGPMTVNATVTVNGTWVVS